MLSELCIKDFAIIDSQTISFRSGLNVISGETGAGKSVILQALELILGGRPSPKYLIPDTEGWELQALFTLSDLPADLREKLPDGTNTDELLITRTMNHAGRGRVYINGRLATVQMLQETCSVLVQICSQGGQSRLLNPDYHLELIDDFAGLGELRQQYAMKWERLRDKKKELSDIEARKEKSLLRTAELHYVVDELGEVELGPEVRSSYEKQIKELEATEHLLSTGQSLRELYTADDGLYTHLFRLKKEYEALARMYDRFEPLADQVAQATTLIEDSELELEKALSSTESDEEALELLRGKLSRLSHLQRKYSTDEKGLCTLLEQAQAELSLIQGEGDTDKLRAEIDTLETQVRSVAEKLSKKRGEAAKKLVSEVTEELKDLNMKHTALHISHERVDYRMHGQDRIEFMLRSSKGEKVFPLREIASGGELSRILLVLKKVLRDKTGVNVLVFDEVDTGISGSVARGVGEKLKSVATDSQVVCITHLAQVASLADAHFLVNKLETGCAITELSQEEKIEEIARMLAGYKVTAASRESARELLTSI